MLTVLTGVPTPAGGTATVVSSNPVATLHDESLTDPKDADYPALAAAYRTVTLTRLDGSGYLHGGYAYVDSSTGPLAQGTFTYHRNDDRFEQVMARYWATRAQLHLQALGSTYVDNEPLRIKINQ